MKKIIDYKNIHEMIKTTVDRIPNAPAYRWILDDEGNMETVTWSQFYEDVHAVSKALIRSGIHKGDKICIFSYTSYRWVVCDLGTLSIGACTVGIYHSSILGDCEYIIRHSGSKIIFVENETQLEKIIAIRKKILNVKKVVLLSGSYSGPLKKWIISYAEFLGLASFVKDAVFTRYAGSISPHDIATIVYTSGTTGVPRGAMITHDNLIFSSQSIASQMPIEEGDDTVLFLPLAHIFARVDVYGTISSRITLTFCRSLDTVINDIKYARPHWFPSVPRVYEKIYARVTGAVETKGGIVLKLFKWGLNVGMKVSDRIMAGKPIPKLLAIRYRIAYKLIFKKLHDALGGRIRFCVSGAAPLSSHVAKFFHAAGIIILEGYGMTENASYSHTNRIDAYKFGTVGFTPPGVEHKIADDGEILCKGRNIMKGYYKLPVETAAVIDRKGWLHTGDLGFIDEEGFLHITGRKKDLIITSGGKNIPPAPIEDEIKTSRYVNQVCLIGDRRNYLTAIVSLDADAVQDFARKNKIQFQDYSELLGNSQVNELIRNVINTVNKNHASFETVKKFSIVPEFTIESSMMTATMKIKRDKVMEKYKDLIDSMYAGK